MADPMAGSPLDDIDLSSIEADLERFQQDDVVREALGKGVDLRSYSRQIDGDLQALQASSIPEFIAEAPATAALYHELVECDGILGGLETVLEGFQQDLGGISDEIKHLQDESLSMSVKLKNRKAVETRLAQVLSRIIVPEELVVAVCESPVDERYVELCRALDDKVTFARQRVPLAGAPEGSLAPGDTQAAQEAGPQLEKLRLKATARVRGFLLAHMAALKKPKTNVQMLQQNVLLRHRYFVQFLAKHAPAVCEEVKDTYVDTMSRVLFSLFKSYWAGLGKLQLPGPPKDDVVGVDEALLEACARNPASMYAAPPGEAPAPAPAPAPAAASQGKLAARELALGAPDAPPVVVHVQRSKGERLHFEAIFRSVQKHLMDSAASEFLFMLDFFDAKSTDMFNHVFARTLSLCLEHVENYLYTCHDAVALLLMIRVTQAHRLRMEKRRVPCLDRYFDHMNMMLWPQLKKVVDANLDSLRGPAPLTVAASSKARGGGGGGPPAATAAAVAAGQARLARLGVARLEPRVHYVSRRFAQFTSTMYALSTSLSASDEMLPHRLVSLRRAYDALLDALVAGAAASKAPHRLLATPRGRLVFRINNVDAVLGCFAESAHSSSGDDVAALEEALAADTALYIEEELGGALAPVLALLAASAEAAAVGGAAGGVDVDVDVDAVLRGFSADWRTHIEQTQANVKALFQSPALAQDVLKQTLAQYVIYFKRLEKAAPEAARQRSLHVTMPQIMAEIKRYSYGGGSAGAGP